VHGRLSRSSDEAVCSPCMRGVTGNTYNTKLSGPSIRVSRVGPIDDTLTRGCEMLVVPPEIRHSAWDELGVD
jgi:hypothetical protein